MRHEVVLVVTEDRTGVARIPRLLHDAECRVTVLGNPKAPVRWSRYVNRFIECPPAGRLLIPRLRKLLDALYPVVPFVILADENALAAAGEYSSEKWIQDIFPVDLKGRGKDVILRKTSFMSAMLAAGVPVPPVRICRTLGEAMAAKDELRFPLFMKRDIDCAGAGVRQIMDATEIPAAFSKLSDQGPVVIQQMIHGQIGKTSGLFKRGRPMCFASAYAIKSWPRFGPSAVRQYLCHPRLEELARKIGEATGFNGLCGFDWIHDSESGEFIVIEFNGRLISNYHLGHHVGIDYPRALNDFLCGRFSEQRPYLLPGVHPVIHMFPQDIRRCITDRDMLGLLKWMVGGVTNDIPWSDANLILFFCTDFIRLGYERLRRFIRRNMRRVTAPSAAAPRQRRSLFTISSGEKRLRLMTFILL